MALSPAHQFGQFIGDLLEAAIEPLLTAFAQEHSLFLDKRGPRTARRGVKVAWTDLNGNRHDLDFVLERNGSLTRIGSPAAFIETAWRRYTKHSRNKAQEIQGAILPLRETYWSSGPFLGAVLAGVFTQGALTQLRSLGFVVAYFPYLSVVEAFSAVGIDARFDENTADADFDAKVRGWQALPPARKAYVAQRLVELNKASVDEFFESLNNAVLRTIQLVRILALHGTSVELASVKEAISFIDQYDETHPGIGVTRYEVEIRFANGEVIRGQFADKAGVIQFLAPFNLSR